MADDAQQTDIRMDASQLYREETFTDRRVGTILRLTPVYLDGKRDEDREIRYIGQAQLMTAAGALPLSFELEADSLHKAVDLFAEGANKASEEMVERLKEMQRESASSILTPDSAGGGLGGQGGVPGGGRIKL